MVHSGLLSRFTITSLNVTCLNFLGPWYERGGKGVGKVLRLNWEHSQSLSIMAHISPFEQHHTHPHPHPQPHTHPHPPSLVAKDVMYEALAVQRKVTLPDPVSVDPGRTRCRCTSDYAPCRSSSWCLSGTGPVQQKLQLGWWGALLLVTGTISSMVTSSSQSL